MVGLTIENRESGALTRLRPLRHDVTHRLVVLGESVSDVANAAGGWLFDQGLAGSKATVLLTVPADDRPLRILGADAVELETAFGSEVRHSRPNTLVVAADLFRVDAQVRHGVIEAIDEGLTDVMIWGGSWPTEFAGLTMPVQHPLTIAARAFKKKALAAAGVASDSVAPVEAFRRIDLRARRSEGSRLVTAS